MSPPYTCLLHASFSLLISTVPLPPFLEPSIFRASFHESKTNLLYLGVFPWGRSMWHHKLRAEQKCRRRKSRDRLWGKVAAETEVVAFSLPAQGEDRPCFVKRFLPAELFSQYQSKRDHWEISERKRRLHVYPEFPGSPWHTAHSVNQSVYCHFNNHPGCFCHSVLCTGQIAVRPPQSSAYFMTVMAK